MLTNARSPGRAKLVKVPSRTDKTGKYPAVASQRSTECYNLLWQRPVETQFRSKSEQKEIIEALVLFQEDVFEGSTVFLVRLSSFSVWVLMI